MHLQFKTNSLLPMVLKYYFFELSIIFLLLCSTNAASAQSKIEDKTSNTGLVDQYIQSKGYKGTICFDAQNIKQYWIDNSVLGKDDSIRIMLKENNDHVFESIPLKIQLLNVNETQDCRIDIITQEPIVDIFVINNNLKIISKEATEEDFIQHHIVSSTFHLEDTINNCFFIQFSSKMTSSISIEKIVLSFSDNKESSFFSPPGSIVLKQRDWIVQSTASSVENINKGLVIKGKENELIARNKIYVLDNSLTYSVKVKNIGQVPTRVYVGYAPYDKDRKNINARVNPYNNSNKVLKVISAEKGNNIVKVDTYPDWAPGCFLVLNAKDDLSDYPNFHFIENKIVSATKVNDNKTEIVLEKDLSKTIEKGSLLRVQSSWGYKYLYTSVKVLQPGEEAVLSSTIKKDENFLRYSPEAFCRGTYYVQPIFFSISLDSNKENSLLISDCTITY